VQHRPVACKRLLAYGGRGACHVLKGIGPPKLMRAMDCARSRGDPRWQRARAQRLGGEAPRRRTATVQVNETDHRLGPRRRSPCRRCRARPAPVQDQLPKARSRREFGIRMQRIVVAAQPIQRRLRRQSRLRPAARAALVVTTATTGRPTQAGITRARTDKTSNRRPALVTQRVRASTE
jgi:hypothetical protein